jgi:hypothetical protein
MIAEGQKNGSIATSGQPQKERSSSSTILSPQNLTVARLISALMPYRIAFDTLRSRTL